jgi:hypothetical protein
MPKRSVFLSTLFGLAFATAALAQNGVPSADRIIRFNGSVAGASAGAQTLRFAVYDEETGGNLLWEEVQTAAVDAAGNFTVFLGGTSTDGLPVALFANGAPRWLSIEQAGTAAGPRVLLAAVPYAVSAANATSLGGRPATDYLLTPQARAAAAAGTSGAATADREPLPLVNNGTANFIGKFFNNVDLINSQLFDNGTNVGVGTSNPFDKFHVQFTNTAGSLTGYAVRNLGSTATSYSGMLFYDHTGTLRQFQGYSNGTGEYRINNISPSGSINFLVGSDSKFKVATSGDIGLGSGTLTPSQRISNYGNAQDDVTFRSHRHGGTIAAPTATSNGSNLLRLEGAGYTGTLFTGERGYMQVISSETWTPSANGTEINFGTTANGSTTVTQRMSILNNGDVEVGSGSTSVKLIVGALANDAGNLSVSGDGNLLQGVAMLDRLNDDGTLIRFRRNGTSVGTIDVAGGVVSYNAFTGSHFARTDEVIERGMLVSLTGQNGRLEDNANSELLYGITRSQRANDPAIMGAYLARQNAAAANLSESVNPHLVEAVGNGEMWVVDTGRNLAAGEYLVSSAVAGHAMTDPGTFETSYIIARLAAPIDWQTVTDTVRGTDGQMHKRVLASVFFESFVVDRTAKSEIKALHERIAALEAALKALTATTVQQQR